MANRDEKNILMLALKAGEIMLISGSEIYRVEDTVTRICKAYGIPFVEIFATTTGIFMTLDSGGDSKPYTIIKRIKGISIDLKKVSLINSFSRNLHVDRFHRGWYFVDFFFRKSFEQNDELILKTGRSNESTIRKPRPWPELPRILRL